MEKITYTRDQVIQLIDEILNRPDLVTDAVQNEFTNHSAESLLETAEQVLGFKAMWSDAQAELEYQEEVNELHRVYNNQFKKRNP